MNFIANVINASLFGINSMDYMYTHK